jgi:hypothetical protein
MPITTHKGTTPAERADLELDDDTWHTVTCDDYPACVCRPAEVCPTDLYAALTEAHRSGAIEALTQARDAACKGCCKRWLFDADSNWHVKAKDGWPRNGDDLYDCTAVEVRRLLEEYGTKPTAEGTR